MNILFNILCYIHLSFWIFVIFAFLDKRTAYINLYYIIPMVYLLHILPFHIINKTKEMVEPDNTKEKVKKFENYFLPVYLFYQIKDFFNFSFQNPLNGRGLLLFGAITSAYALK